MVFEVVSLLSELNLKISLAESCTGGMISSTIVGVNGASKVLLGGFVTYTNEMKMKMLNVSCDTLNKYTAVSNACAKEMALGCKNATGADIAVSVTGYAGPLDLPEEPKGLVYIGCAYKDINYAKEYRFDGERNEIREKAADSAMELIREILLNEYKGK